jgi:hypothetical protein
MSTMTIRRLAYMLTAGHLARSTPGEWQGRPWSGGERADEVPADFQIQGLAVGKARSAHRARDRLDCARRLILRPYSSCMRWLTGEAPGS